MIGFSELRMSADKSKLLVGCFVEDFDFYENIYIDSVYVDYYKNRLASGSPSDHAKCLYKNKLGKVTEQVSYDIENHVFYVTNTDAIDALKGFKGSKVTVRLTNSGVEGYSSFEATLGSVAMDTNTYARHIVTFSGYKADDNPYMLIQNDTQCSVWVEDPDTTVKSLNLSLSTSEISKKTFGVADFADGLFYVYVICGGVPGSTTECGKDNMTTIGVLADWELVYTSGMHYISDIIKPHLPCKMNGIVGDGFTDFILRWNALKLGIKTCDYDSVDKLWNTMLEVDRGADYGCGCKGKKKSSGNDVTFTVNVNVPANITINGELFENATSAMLSVAAGSLVSWSVSKTDYVPQSGFIKPSSDSTKNVVLVKQTKPAIRILSATLHDYDDNDPDIYIDPDDITQEPVLKSIVMVPGDEADVLLIDTND